MIELLFNYHQNYKYHFQNNAWHQLVSIKCIVYLLFFVQKHFEAIIFQFFNVNVAKVKFSNYVNWKCSYL